MGTQNPIETYILGKNSKEVAHKEQGGRETLRIPQYSMMKVLSWHSRGLGHPSKIVALKDLIAHEKAGILMLQETK